MNKIIIALIYCLLSVSESSALENIFTVLVRAPGSHKTYLTRKALPHLEGAQTFDGTYFKIVKGKTNEAISLQEEDRELLLKASTVYYHLNFARDFWVGNVGSEMAQNMPQITVRLELTNQYDDLGHFAHDNRQPQFNNALSVPDGETPEWVPEGKKDKWGKEIWFRPSKNIPTKELGDMGPNPITVSLRALEDPLINYTQNQFNQRLLEEFFYPAYASRSLSQDVVRYAGTVAIMKLIIYGSSMADSLFLDKYYYLDTAMVPEIIYHEYSHLILSDTLEMSHSTPVNEGMADYFAAIMSKQRKIYGKVPGRSNSRGKDTEEKKKYSHWDESNRNATGDFALSVLWDVRETLGEEVSDKLVYESRKYLKTESSTISDGLLRAILRACDSTCESPRRDKYRLYETFLKKGF